MQIILANYNEIDPVSLEGRRLRTPKEVLEHYFLLTDWTQGIVRAGLQMDVFLRSRSTVEFQDQGVSYHFLPDRSPAKTYLYLPFRMHRKIVSLVHMRVQAGVPVLVHVNGLLFPLQIRMLRATLGPNTPIIAQHHGSFPWKDGIRRSIQRWGLAPVDGFMFAVKELASDWIATGLISPEKVHEVMELTSHFKLQDRRTARRQTGLFGEPVVFWAGNLDHNKDPLTILAGFEGFLERWPAARLYMAFRNSGLLEDVRQFIEARPALKRSIRLLGRIPYPQMEAYFNSADLFVQGSGREGSGLALMDALACGVQPVVTDIPTFREILKGGQVGSLWPVGDAHGFLGALETAMVHPPSPQEIQAFFQSHWHADQIAKRAVTVYRTLVASG